MKKQLHILRLIVFSFIALFGVTTLYGEVTLVTYTRNQFGITEYIDKKDAYADMVLQPDVNKITLATISDDLAGCLRTLSAALEIERLSESGLANEIALPKEVFSRDITQATFLAVFLPLIEKLILAQKETQEDILGLPLEEQEDSSKLMSAALSALIVDQCQNVSLIQLLQLLQIINYFDVTIANISIAPLIADYIAKYFYENYIKQESVDGLRNAIIKSYSDRNTLQRSLILPENINQYVTLDVFSNVNSLVASYILYKITQEKPELFELWYCLHTFTGHTKAVLSAAFNHNGTQVVTASYDNTAKIWDVATGQCLHTLRGHTDMVSSAAFSPDGTQVVTASSDGTAKIWNVVTGQCLHTLREHTGSVKSAAFNHYGTQVVTASSDRTVKIWDVATGQCLHTLDRAHGGHTDLVYSAAFNHDGTQVVTASSDETAKIWDVATGQCLHTLDREHGGHTDSVYSVAFNHDGTQVVTASYDNTAKIWDVATGQCLHTLRGHTNAVNSAAYNHDGMQVVTASLDNTAKIWDVATGQCLHTLRGHTNEVNSAAYNHDGMQVVTASLDNTAKIWDVATGQCLHTLDREHGGHAWYVTSAAYNHDGTQVVTASYDNIAKIWQYVKMSDARRDFLLYQILFVYMLDAMKNAGQKLNLSAQTPENQILLNVLNSFNDEAKKYLIKNYDINVAQDIVSQQASDVGASAQHAVPKSVLERIKN